jgi:23S rRNA pseudouridine2605 synthase
VAKVRIQKLLSEAGVASRRAIEEMIVEGRITVNDKFVLELPCFVDPDADRITVDDDLISLAGGPKRYILLNKPRDVVCTSRDEMGRRRAIDCIPPVGERLYCVGRLDADSTGLILLTNDGDLTQHLTHPSRGVVKTYLAEIDGHLTAENVERFKKGVHLDGRRTAGAMIRVLKRAGGRSLLEVRLTEGRNREIRRVLVRLGHKVRRLHRSTIGPVNDRGLKVGSWRELSAAEVNKLRQCGGFTAKRAQPPTGKPGRTKRAKPPTAEKTGAAKMARKRIGAKKPTTLRKLASDDKPSAKRLPRRGPAAKGVAGAKKRPNRRSRGGNKGQAKRRR